MARGEGIATDIDPISIDVTARQCGDQPRRRSATARANCCSRSPTAWTTTLLAARAPFDLLIANILAGPLIELAPSFAAGVAPGATVILAGLLDTQADAVIAAYEAQGMTLVARGEGEWCVLVLEAKGR